MERTHLVLSHPVYRFDPSRLADVRQKLPVTAEGYVPIMMFGRELPMETPMFIGARMGTVALSLGRPFGFMRGQFGGDIEQSVQTYGIGLRQLSERNRWLAELHTEEPVTAGDEDIIRDGIWLYAQYALPKINRLP